VKRTVRVNVAAIVVRDLPAAEAAAFGRSLEAEIRRRLQGTPHAPAPQAWSVEALAAKAAAAIGARLPKEARKG
jgi:hypothetical protein